MQLAEFLQQNFPSSIEDVSGGNFPAPEYATHLMSLLSFIQIFTLAAMFIGDGIFSMIPFISGPPKWYFAAKENPAFIMMSVFIFIPTVLNSFVVSGAFEVAIDGVVVFSKLESGMMPTGPMIIEAFAKAGIQQG